MNNSILLEPFSFLISKKHQVSLKGSSFSSPLSVLVITQLRSGKAISLDLTDPLLLEHLRYFKDPFTPVKVSTILDRYFALQTYEVFREFIRKEIYFNASSGLITYDHTTSAAYLTDPTGAKTYRIDSGLALGFLAFLRNGVYSKTLFLFLDSVYSSKLATRLIAEDRLAHLAHLLPDDTLVSESGHIGLYVKTDHQGYMVDNDGKATPFNLNRLDTVVFPNVSAWTAGRVTLRNPQIETVWKVLVTIRDIRDINDKGEIYVDKFIPVRENSSFKEDALRYNISARRIESFFKVVPKQALALKDYIPPEPCYWGIEYYNSKDCITDDSRKERTHSS